MHIKCLNELGTTLRTILINREQMASCNFKKINKVTLFIEITVCLRKKWNEHRELELREMNPRLAGQLVSRLCQNLPEFGWIIHCFFSSWSFFNKEKRKMLKIILYTISKPTPICSPAKIFLCLQLFFSMTKTQEVALVNV